MKKILSVLAIIFAVSSPLFAGGFGKDLGNFFREKAKEIVSAKIQERFEQKREDRQDTRQVNRDAQYQNTDIRRDGIQSRNQALNEVNNWYRQELSNINRRFQEKTDANPGAREELKSQKKEELDDLKVQYDTELQRVNQLFPAK